MKRVNLGIILRVIISFLDDVLVIIAIIWVMSRLGFKIPWWLIASLAVIFIALSIFSYLGLRKNPSLGFEKMIGKSGLTTETLHKRGTVRIGHELWYAEANEYIEKGVEVTVTAQNGLKLFVVRKL